MREKKLLFIYNPHAGKAAMKNKLSDVMQIFMKADYEVTVYATQREQEATELVMELGKNYDRVICSGGDGTLHEVTQGLLNLEQSERPTCGYIPTGTVNDFARGLGIPLRVKAAAENSVRETTQPVDIGMFNGKCFTYVAAFGAFTSVAYETPQAAKNMLGKMAYILDGMSQLPSIKAYHAVIETESERIEDDFLFGMISNAKSIGGFPFFKKSMVSLNDGLFEGVFIKKPTNPLEINATLNAAMTMKPNDQIIGMHGKKFSIKAEEEIRFTLDGEDGGAFKDSEIVCCHNAIDYVWGK